MTLGKRYILQVPDTGTRVLDNTTPFWPGGGVLSGKVGTGMCGPDRVHF